MTRPMILVAAMAAALSLAAYGSDTGPATTEGGTVQAAHTDPTAPANGSAERCAPKPRFPGSVADTEKNGAARGPERDAGIRKAA